MDLGNPHPQSDRFASLHGCKLALGGEQPSLIHLIGVSKVDLVTVTFLAVVELLCSQIINQCLFDKIWRELGKEDGRASCSTRLGLVNVNLLGWRLFAGPGVLRILVELVDG